MNRKNFFFILINLFIFITTAIAVPVTLIVGSRATRLDNLGIPYWEHIVTFTILSNIFLGLVALAAVLIAIVNFNKNRPLPKALATWYLTAVSAGMLTFLTVILFLAPMRAIGGKNYFDMLLESMFFLHFLNPLLAALTFIFLMDGAKVQLKSRLLAVLPIIIYAIPYATCVIILKIWPDFYGVTFGGRYYLTPLVFLVFCAVLFGISSALAWLHNKRLQKTPKIC